MSVPAPSHGTGAHVAEADAAELVGRLASWTMPVVLLDRDGIVRAWNRGAATLYGYSEVEAIGLGFQRLVGMPDPEGPLSPPVEDAERYEGPHRTKDARTVHVVVARSGVLGPGGDPQGTLLFIIDLSGSKIIEGRLERRVAQLSVVREIGEVLQSAMGLTGILRTILVGATASQGLRFNRAFLLLADEKRGELRGRLAIGPSDPEEAYRIWSELSQSQTGLKDLLREYEPFLERTNTRVNEIVRGLGARLDDDASFLIRAMRSATTIRVCGGNELNRGGAVDRALIERLGVDTFVAVPLVGERKPVGLLVADNAITGRPIEDEEVGVLELLGMQAALAIERAQLSGELETQISALETATLEIRANQERILRAERLSAIGEMAARVAHDIRNPLVAIGGFARLLLREAPPAGSVRESIQIIVAEVDRLEAILRDVLDFSTPARPQIGSLDPLRLASDALELLQWEMTGAGVTGRLEADSVAPPARGDRNQLFQALINLMRNAIHAMPAGGTLTLKVRQLPGWLEMTVADTGEGMPPEVCARIFEPFYTTKPTGSGLGLTIAEQIVRENGGEIHVESQVGAGTTFYLRFPAAEETSHVEDPGR